MNHLIAAACAALIALGGAASAPLAQTRAAENEQAVVGATATLEVSGRDAEVLALAKSEGELSLVLRSYADTAGPSGRTAAATARGAGPAAGSVVRVYREGQSESVAVP